MELEKLTVYQLVAINRVNRKKGVYHITNRPYCAVCYKTEGHTVYTQNGKDCISDRHSVIIIPAGASYSFEMSEQGECYVVEFIAVGIGEEICRFLIKNDAEVLSVLKKIEYAFTFKKAGFMAFCLSGLYSLFYHIMAQNDLLYLSNTKKQRIQPSITFLEENYNNNAVNMDEIASLSGVSQVYFRKLFTEIYGTTPKKYINLIRMTKARELLLTKELTVQQVADEVGFSDVYSFSKSFSKAHGCSPMQYRKNQWK